MAFTSNTLRSNDASTSDEKWKAQGFINVFMDVVKKGKETRVKVGVLPLKDSVELHRMMREWLEKNPEDNAPKLRDRFVLEYRSAEPVRGQLAVNFDE